MSMLNAALPPLDLVAVKTEEISSEKAGNAVGHEGSVLFREKHLNMVQKDPKPASQDVVAQAHFTLKALQLK